MASSAQQKKLERFASEIAPRVQQRMERFVKVVIGGGDLRKAVSDALYEVGSAEHGLEGLKFMLSMLAHCTAVNVRAADVVDPKGKVRIETKAAIKSLIESKLFDGKGAPLRLVHPDSGTLSTVLTVLFVLALVVGILAGVRFGAAVRKLQWEIHAEEDGMPVDGEGGERTSQNFGYLDDADKEYQLPFAVRREGGTSQTLGFVESADFKPNKTGILMSMALAGTASFYLYHGWAAHVPVQGIARDLRGCVKELVDVERALAAIGAKPQDSPKQRRRILRECPGASMFAVLSPSGQPLTKGQMRAVQQRGQVGFEMAYGGTGCFEEPRTGVVATLLSIPGSVLSALLPGR